MIIYVDYLRNSTVQPPELINELNNIIGAQVNREKSDVLFCTSKKQLENETFLNAMYSSAKKHKITSNKFNRRQSRPL